MRLSACFLSFLLSRPQTATALQRNTRPSAYDAPLPVYGQETVRPVPLPHYRAGKVSFFCPRLSKLQQNSTIWSTPWQIWALIWQCLRTSGSWSSYFPCWKIGKSQFPFFAFQGFLTAECLRFYWPRRERKGYFMVKRDFFFSRDNLGKSRASQDRIQFILPAREFSRRTESLIK